jgi:mitochondrial import inner membrane translocase subunit TIM10
MSMFGRGSGTPSGAVNPERVEMAMQECVLIPSRPVLLLTQILRLDMVTDVFNRLVSQVFTPELCFVPLTPHFRTCHAKCINTRYTEGDLSKGESVCIDRCVAKFFEANKKVGERLQSVVGANAGATGVFGL